MTGPENVTDEERGWGYRFWTRRRFVLLFGLLVVVAAGVGVQYHSNKLFQFLHLAVPGFVVVMEFYMLGQMRKEEHARARESEERQRVVEDLNNFRISIGRANYMGEIARAIGGAKRQVIFTSASMRTMAADPDQKQIVDAVKRLEQQQAGYKHYGIVPEDRRVIPGAIELLCHTKIDLRMSDFGGNSRARFLIADKTVSVIGMPDEDSTIAQNSPTKRSFTVRSSWIAQALSDQFFHEHDRASTPWEWLARYIEKMKAEDSSYSKQHILQFLGDADVKRATMAEKCPAFAALPDEPVLEPPASRTQPPTPT
jgi:hypothetical protein